MIYLDFETYSESDLKVSGVAKYARHSSTKILCMAFKLPDSDKIYQWIPGQNREHLILFKHLNEHLNAAIWAWNSNFEYEIWNSCGVINYDFPPFSNFKCSMSLSANFGSPLNLEDAGEYFKASVLKMKEGRKALLKLCKPGRAKGTPEDFEILYEYNRFDVASEIAIHDKFPSRDFTPFEKELFDLTVEMNRKGITVDLHLVSKMAAVVKYYFLSVKRKIFDLSEGKINSPNQRVKILKLLQEFGAVLPDLQAKTVSDFLLKKDDLHPVAVEILQARQDMANNSLKKFQVMLDLAIENKIYYSLQYFGAHTGRFSGRGIQPQNFPRNSICDEEAFAIIKNLNPEAIIDFASSHFKKPFSTVAKGFLRPCITSSPGKVLLAGDFKAIENRVAAWVSDDKDTLAKFKNGEDQYIDMAKAIYKKKEISPTERQMGKRIVLGCQFGLGPEGLIKNLKAADIEIDFFTAADYVRAYRKKYFKMVQFWDSLAFAALDAFSNRKRTCLGNISIYRSGEYLCFLLPSGRQLFFGGLKVGIDKFGYKGIFSGNLQFHRGIIFQNIVQAIARDIMASAMLRLKRKDFNLVLTVHDEIVVDAFPLELPFFKEIMLEGESWFSDMPIECEFYESERFL